MQEALLYEKLADNKVRCQLCAHNCLITDGHKGICQVRENRAGTLYTLVYGHSISQNIDPIEKKPLYHVYPGSLSFSVATPGCNFRCDWCQNWQISQQPRESELRQGRALSAQQIVNAARHNGCRSIAYTYTEPTISFEYNQAAAQLAKQADIANIYVSNGYMSAQMLEQARHWLTAANIDLKAFRDQSYRQYVGARLQPVLDSLKRLRFYGIWLEVTTLVIPGINDDPAELKDIADFIAQELGVDTPWHLSRFVPHYKMKTTPPTPLATIEKALAIGREAGLHYVYPGNIKGPANSHCPQCGALVIAREGYRVMPFQLDKGGNCLNCGQSIAGIW